MTSQDWFKRYPMTPSKSRLLAFETEEALHAATLGLSLCGNLPGAAEIALEYDLIASLYANAD